MIFVAILLSVTLLIVQIYIVKLGSQYEPKVSVVYANQKIAAKTVVTEAMLEKKDINMSLVNKQSVTDIAAIVGKKAKIDIESGEMLLSSKVTDKNEMEDINVENKNNRLFTLELKGDQANGWWLKVDQHVDVLYVHNTVPVPQPDGSVKEDKIIERLNNIRIAALITQEGTLLKNDERNTLPKYVCLELDTKQDELLAYAKTNGRIELSVVPVVE